MSNTAYELTNRLLNALDSNYNVVDMCAISGVISELENINITKELLETTRLGKHVNELRRHTRDLALARRAKLLVKRWRDLVIPSAPGSKPSNASSGVDSSRKPSPLATRGVSTAVTPSVTPRLCSPLVPQQGVSLAQNQGSLTSSPVQPLQQRRQPLSSPALQNLSQSGQRSVAATSPILKRPPVNSINTMPTNANNASPNLKNLSPNLKNVSPNLKNISPNLRNISPGLKPGVIFNTTSPNVRNLSPNVRNLSPNVRNLSPNVRNLSPGAKDVLIKNAVRSQPSAKVGVVKDLGFDSWSSIDTVNIGAPKKLMEGDSDSDVILVDDDSQDEDAKPGKQPFTNDRANISPIVKGGKRPRSPINGASPSAVLETEDPGVRRQAKKARREPGGRKSKKRRNHTKSENRTVDHSLDPVGSPFLPISSASTSPALGASLALRNGLNQGPSPLQACPVVVDDVDSRSPAPILALPDPKPAKASRKNGCKKPAVDMDEYSRFIKNKIPKGGKKLKSTQELLDDIQARSAGNAKAAVEKLEKESAPKEDFLTAYDSQKLHKKEFLSAPIVTDIIELNDSNSSGKVTVESVKDTSLELKTEKVEAKEQDGPVKFEPLEVILAKLPPINREWANEEEYVPVCTCKLIYNTPEVTEIKMPSPPPVKRSIFELDYEEAPKEVKTEDETLISIPALPLFEERLDPDCEAAEIYHKRPSNVADNQVFALHNCYVPNVNGNRCVKDAKAQPNTVTCKMNEWGLRPFYDCSNDLFHSVVPKYNYLDYSLDRCVKNLSKLEFDKYEPAEATANSEEWYLELERKHPPPLCVEDLKTEEFHSSADLPFSEKPGAEGDSVIKIEPSDSKDDVNLDSNTSLNCGDHNDAPQEMDTSTNNNDPSFNKLEEMEDEDDEAYDQEDYEDDPEISTCLVKQETEALPKKPRFAYGDSVMLLPLSLTAINASPGAEFNLDNDLSSVFRTESNQLVFDEITYDALYPDATIAAADILEYKDITNTVTERLKRSGKAESPVISSESDDANCDKDVVKREGEVGALVGVGVACDRDAGCPVWLGRSQPTPFREWHEPVLTKSYNDEPLTVLPYVVID